ncbi:MAG: hypothetical protein BRC50_13645 [Cyanobacteria bacterium SW_11_48_12]|nr:MAG: hypothetical protein BRC50_13645 [Cyanobacteria bacterium SW_11_48_12]
MATEELGRTGGQGDKGRITYPTPTENATLRERLTANAEKRINLQPATSPCHPISSSPTPLHFQRAIVSLFYVWAVGDNWDFFYCFRQFFQKDEIKRFRYNHWGFWVARIH